MNMEVSVGEFGRMIFEEMLVKYEDLPEHWQSIKKEAEPLVRQLLDLNKKMKNGGYKIYGYEEKSGNKKKKKLSDWERIRTAQTNVWGINASELIEGDKIWLLYDGEFEMYIGEHDPVTVEIIKGSQILVTNPHALDRNSLYKIKSMAKVLKAPTDWDENKDLYESKNYWLKKADELDI